MGHTNRLINASSPYLLQHAHNPVDWWEWSDEAWQKAVDENKPVLVSVGYAACHWCHVMEHECFEDEVTAAIMNSHYICIKVDREERPDVDAVYMDACQLITGRGGWPMNVFCLPDGRPLHAGTYFPKPQWDDMLKKLSDFYAERKEEAITYAQKLTEGVKQLDLAALAPADEEANEQVINKTLEKWMTMFDPVLGGYNWAPKFPMPSNYSCLLHLHNHNCHPTARFQVENTLNKMALGGIYDQLGGGFSRYSVDAEWKVPHFEKMLYDNAQLISLYSKTYRLTKNNLYSKTIIETIDFLKHELMNENGLFYSALDADSEGVEGKFYVWKQEEIDAILGDDSALFCDYFRIGEDALWEHGENVLMAVNTVDEFADAHRLDFDETLEIINRSREKLLAARATRIRPGLDDKVICSWNALMITGLCDAYGALLNDDYKEMAVHLARTLLKELYHEGQLYRIWKNGRHTIPAFAEDYALLAEALMKLYEITFEEQYLILAKELVDTAFVKFFDHETGFFRMKSVDDAPLYTTKIDVGDDVIPSANSVFATTLYKLGFCFGDEHYIDKAMLMLSKVTGMFHKFPTGYANWFELFLLKQYGFFQVVFTKQPSAEVMNELSRFYLPHLLFAVNGTIPLTLHKNDEEFKIYVCKDKTCHAPVSEIDNMISIIFS